MNDQLINRVMHRAERRVASAKTALAKNDLPHARENFAAARRLLSLLSQLRLSRAMLSVSESKTL